MKRWNRLLTGLLVLITLMIPCGITGAEIPAFSVQNAHSFISADFSADIISGAAPLTIQFSDLSKGPVDSRLWDFGDGGKSDEQHPVHLFNVPGVYTVSLSISGTGGSDKKTRIGYITVTEPPIQDEPVFVLSEEIFYPDQIDDTVVQSGQLEPVPELVASFSYGDTIGLAPHTVEFIDESLGNVEEWLWDFGDGTSSSSNSPIHIFQQPGSYTVTLTVIDKNRSDTAQKTGLIQVIEPVNADFIAEGISGEVPITVSFTDESTGSVLKREWSFGDGFTSDKQNPAHTYLTPGRYDVSLTVYGLHNQDIKTIPSLIDVLPTPTPEPTLKPTLEPTPEIVIQSIEDTPEQNSGDADIEPELTGEETVKSYELVPLTETSQTSTDDLIEQEIISESTDHEPDTPPVIPVETDVSESSPTPEPEVKITADFSLSSPSGIAPHQVQFTDLSTGDVSTWLWDFGDGVTSDEQNPVHVYESSGYYDVILRVSGPSGVQESVKPSVVVVSEPVQPPRADFIINNNEGIAPLPIVCTDASTGEISEWIWNFGDGKVVKGRNPTYTYTIPGEYSVTLTVKGPGGKDSQMKDSAVRVSPPKVSSITELSVDISEGEAPLTVQFSDLSTGEVSGWLWDFGDGSTSTERNPAHTYSKPGIYSVQLTIDSPDTPSPIIKEDLITVLPKQDSIKPFFTALPVSGEAPLTVAFSDLSTGEVTGWHWDFGDGITSDLQNPSHSYNNPGMYDVTLVVTGKSGEERVFKPGYIAVHGSGLAPEIQIHADPSNGTIPLTVSFSVSGLAPQNKVEWEFGDGNISLENKPSHIYYEPGLFTVSLTIREGSEISRIITKNEFINATPAIKPPIADFTCNRTTGSPPLHIGFTDLSTGEISERVWDYGDGTVVNTSSYVHSYAASGIYSVQLTAIGPGGVHTVSKENLIQVEETGEEVIREPLNPETDEETDLEFDEADYELPQRNESDDNLTVDDDERPSELVVTQPLSDPIKPVITSLPTPSEAITGSSPLLDTSGQESDGESSAREPEVAPSYLPPIENQKDSDEPGTSLSDDEGEAGEGMPDIFASPGTGTGPLEVSFTSSWSSNLGNFLWHFGDGTTSDEVNPVHTYNKTGKYSVRLIVADDEGTREIISTDLIHVEDRITVPFAAFTAEPLSGIAPLETVFTSTSVGSIDTISWDFGDGTYGEGASVSHTYEKPGKYAVKLTVTGPGGVAEEVHDDYITVASDTPPRARFSTDVRTGSAPLTVSFTDQSQGTITDRVWKFGDGKVSREQNPVHTYNVTGVYTVSLDVSGPAGSDIVTRPGYIITSIRQDQLIAGFTVSPLSGEVPLIIQCTDNSKGQVLRYLWDFGDGFVSEQKNPIHKYTSPGSYLVTQTVYGRTGTSSADQMIYVNPVLEETKKVDGTSQPGDSKPVADFILSTRSGKKPLTVNCYDNSKGLIESWNWDFGDGQSSEEVDPVYVYKTPGIYTVTLTVTGPDGVSSKKIRDAIRVF